MTVGYKEFRRLILVTNLMNTDGVEKSLTTMTPPIATLATFLVRLREDEEVFEPSN